MPLYEIHVRNAGEWKIVDAYEEFDDAYACAWRIERVQKPEELRVRRVDEVRPGISRVRTMYSGGRNSEREKSLQAARQKAFEERYAIRRELEILSERAKQELAAHRRLRSRTSPLYLTLVSACLVFTGLTALYVVEKSFLP